MEDQVCPRCRTTKYRNPSLKLMVNVCGHSLCESCVDLLFLKGSGSCPECQVPLRRSNFRVQLFEDPVIEKEVDIRKRILRDYTKKEEDFATLEEYNDYLEQVEEIIFNLTNGINTIETNRRIDQYKKENREQILKSKMKPGRGELELEELLEVEKQMEQERVNDLAQEEVEQRRKKIRAKEALIDELMFSHGDAADILKNFQAGLDAELRAEEAAKANVVPKQTQFSTGIKFTDRHVYKPIIMQEEGPLYVYEPPRFECNGPTPPSWVEITAEGSGYLDHIRRPTPDESAGGFDSALSCSRALQEAVVSLYYTNT
uniref:CDK-activating kinase assembly factor MAT1 n=1 Tax=Triatoma dimidiata TaxID=72491 RepID=A0A0V0GC94_TRIDM